MLLLVQSSGLLALSAEDIENVQQHAPPECPCIWLPESCAPWYWAEESCITCALT